MNYQIQTSPGLRPNANAPHGGFTLVELFLALAVSALVFAVTVPALLRATGPMRVRLAAGELAGTLNASRIQAIKLGAYVAVKFYPTDEGTSWALYADGDGDGVRNDDIESGHDSQLRPLRRLRHFDGRVHFGFPEGLRPRDPGDPRQRLSSLHDPIRFNRSDLASFSPIGSSTPGSIYLTDGKELYCVRLYNRTGKVKVLRYDQENESWLTH